MVKETEADKADKVQGNDVTNDGIENIDDNIMKDVMADTEERGKALKLLLSICKALAEDDLIDNDEDVMKSVEYLEPLWQSLWLRILEWECLIEQSLARGEQVSFAFLFSFFIDFLQDDQNTVETDTEEDILKAVDDADNTQCDSSDSGFSDHSVEYDTSMNTGCHSIIQDPVILTSMTACHTRDKRKYRKKKKINCWSWSRFFRFFIILTFLIFILFIICNIKCYNNTCAINISTLIRYYNYNNVV